MVDLVNRVSAESHAGSSTSQDQQSHLKNVIRSAADVSPRFPDFIAELAKQDIEFICYLTRLGRVSSIGYLYASQWQVKASELGDDYTWTGLQRKLGVEYVKIRDFPLLSSFAQSQASSPKKKGSLLVSQSVDSTLLSRLEQVETLEKQILSVLHEQRNIGVEKLSSVTGSLNDEGSENFQQVVNEARDELHRVDGAVQKLEAITRTLSESRRDDSADWKAQLSGHLPPQKLDEELRYSLGEIREVCQRALSESKKSLHRNEVVISKMRQESFWLALVVALTVGLVSALVTGLWVAQQTEKQLAANHRVLTEQLKKNAEEDPLRVYFQKLMDKLP